MKTNTALPPGGHLVKSPSNSHILKRKVPLIPLWPLGEPCPRATERVGLSRATDLLFVLGEILKNAIFTRMIEGGRWAVVHVLAAYTLAFHVMLMEVGIHRYLPSIAWIPDSEGEEMIRLAVPIIREAELRSSGGDVHFGINWSALSHGVLEEKTGGLMSIPTKVHPQIWSWSPEPSNGDGNPDGGGWVGVDELDERQKLMVIGNRPTELLGHFVGNRIRECFLDRGAIGFERSGLLDFGRWLYTRRGLEAHFAGSVAALLGIPGFFSCILKPLTRVLETASQELTEALTTMDCAEMYSILRKTEAGPLTTADRARIQAVPNVRPVEEAKAIFGNKGWPEELLDALLPLVRARCAPESDQHPVETWRVGFGYALVFSGQAFGSSGVLRIMPVAHVGPAGVVEAQGVLLERVRSYAPDSVLRRKGEELHKLVAELEAAFGPDARLAPAADRTAPMARSRSSNV